MTMLMKGKRGLILGIANRHSLAYGIAKAVVDHGGDVILTYQGEAFKKRLMPIADELDAAAVVSCDVTKPEDIAQVAKTVRDVWGYLDFVVHAVAYSDKAELEGRYIDTSQENFLNTLNISCYSLVAVAKAMEPLMQNGGSIVTLSYDGSQRVMPSYNVMGVAKAALESSVRYLATDLGHKKIRVNTLSAGPMRTLAGSAVGSARTIYRWQGENSALGRNIKLPEVGNTGLYLLSDLSRGVTGEVLYLDGGYHAIGMCNIGS